MSKYDPYLQSLLKKASYFSIAVSLILITVKFIAWKITGSVSMHATLMDSFLDSLASLVNWIAIKHALKPSDNEHRFGHGKIEALAGVAQSFFISISALIIFKEAWEHFINPQPVEGIKIGISVMIFSIFLTLVLVRYQMFVIKKTGSLAISGDSLHYRSDILINLGVIASFALSQGQSSVSGMIDAFIAALIAFYIIATAYKIGKEGIDVLMDKEMDNQSRDLIKKIALENSNILHINSLKTRKAGPFVFIQMDAHMDANLTLQEAHDISHEVEQQLLQFFPTACITIHQEATNHDNISSFHSQSI